MSVGEQFPKEQARILRCLENGFSIGPAGAFYRDAGLQGMSAETPDREAVRDAVTEELGRIIAAFSADVARMADAGRSFIAATDSIEAVLVLAEQRDEEGWGALWAAREAVAAAIRGFTDEGGGLK